MNIKYIAVLLLIINGCSIPIKLTTYSDPQEIIKAEKKEKYNKIYNLAMKRLNRKKQEKEKALAKYMVKQNALLEKEKLETIKKKPKKKKPKKKKIIINAKNTFIQAIMIEGNLSEPEATVLWEKYGRSNIKGFSNYLIKTNPVHLQDRFYIEFVERMKVRTKILK